MATFFAVRGLDAALLGLDDRDGFAFVVDFFGFFVVFASMRLAMAPLSRSLCKIAAADDAITSRDRRLNQIDARASVGQKVAERSSEKPDDLRLRLVVMRCQVGDDQAFATLFEWFGPKTLRYLRGLIGDGGDDVHQEVWLTVYRTISGLANPGAFRTWLFRTTRHRAMDVFRRQRRERELVEQVMTTATDASDPWIEDELPDDASVEAEIARLPVLQREALFLRYRDGLSYAEIALVAGVPIGTVKTRIHHALRVLRERFQRGHS